MKTYTLTHQLFSQMKSRLGDRLQCASCGKPFIEGDVVASSYGSCSVILRHKECYDKTVIEA